MWIVWIYTVPNCHHPSACLHSPAGLFIELLFRNVKLSQDASSVLQQDLEFCTVLQLDWRLRALNDLLRFKILGRGLGGVRGQDAQSLALAFAYHFLATRPLWVQDDMGSWHQGVWFCSCMYQQMISLERNLINLQLKFSFMLPLA